ncbi:helix-turn-helix transcriptional regulator [Pedobacter nutrimenti]|uniref:helix-turn-helix domain-containing protein n=1 Tax=Pedobacter nutrimenti TaxID=1241337 RepID=UPI00292F40D3|nr:helix-turn-helix transcriptional regulator [Pedobacter nutrimenti]
MMKDIGNKIRMLRVNSRKKQRHLAEALGISIPAYSKIETGITDINTARLIEIANYFDVRPSLFFEDTEETKKMEEDRRLRDAQFRKMETMVNELQEKLIVTLQENNLLYKKVAN